MPLGDRMLLRQGKEERGTSQGCWAEAQERSETRTERGRLMRDGDPRGGTPPNEGARSDAVVLQHLMALKARLEAHFEARIRGHTRRAERLCQRLADLEDRVAHVCLTLRALRRAHGASEDVLTPRTRSVHPRNLNALMAREEALRVTLRHLAIQIALEQRHIALDRECLAECLHDLEEQECWARRGAFQVIIGTMETGETGMLPVRDGTDERDARRQRDA